MIRYTDIELKEKSDEFQGIYHLWQYEYKNTMRLITGIDIVPTKELLLDRKEFLKKAIFIDLAKLKDDEIKDIAKYVLSVKKEGLKEIDKALQVLKSGYSDEEVVNITSKKIHDLKHYIQDNIKTVSSSFLSDKLFPGAVKMLDKLEGWFNKNASKKYKL